MTPFPLKGTGNEAIHFFEITWHHLWFLSCLLLITQRFLFWTPIAPSSMILRVLAEAIPSASTHFPRNACRSCPPFTEVSVQMSPVTGLDQVPLQNITRIHTLLYIYFCSLHSTLTPSNVLLVFLFVSIHSPSLDDTCVWFSSIPCSLPTQCLEYVWQSAHIPPMQERDS